MHQSSSSPGRPSVKFTYLDRQKRKTEAADDHSPSNSANQSKETLVSSKKKSSITAEKVRGGTIQVETSSNVPASKRARRDSDASTRSATSTKKASHRLSSLIPQNKVAKQAPASPTTPERKPPSVASASSMKPPSSRRLGTPDSEMDDNVSISESTISVKAKRRLEPQRIQYFNNQPFCGNLEPHEAECTKCGKVVKLGRAQTYAVRPWERHRRRCDLVLAPSPSIIASGKYTGKEEDSDGNMADEGSQSSPRLLVEERKALLESDPYVLKFQRDEVTCRNCNATVKLSSLQEYKLYNWQNHRTTCGGGLPSNRVETAARKLRIVNDLQAESFGARHVVCNVCKKTVILSGDEDYNLSPWEAHKSACSRPEKTQTNQEALLEADSETAAISTIPFPVRSPPSIASTTTENTLIAPDNLRRGCLDDSLDIHCIKRMREDDDVDTSPDDPDVRPSNRPRTDESEDAAKEDPSAMGWVTLPFRAFVRGFRESLKRA